MTSAAAALRRPLLVSHSGDPGGSNEVILSLIRHRPPSCEPSALFLADGPMVEAVRDLGIRTEVIESGPVRHLWRAPGNLRRVLRYVRRVRPDLVWAHVSKAHAYASVAASVQRLPYLWWQHDLPGTAPADRIAARLPAAVVICSSDFTAVLQRRLDRSPVECIHPGIELDGRAPPRRRTGRPPTIGAVGRLRRYKRYELVLRAAPFVLEEEPEARFVIAGGPTTHAEYPAKLEALAQSLGIHSSLEMRGHVPGAAAVMHEFDVLVHTAELEPFGLVAAEALVNEVPVVCAPEGGPAELVRDGIDGVHVDVTDARELAGAIVGLIRDPALRERMGKQGAAHVRASFSAARMANEAWELAREVALRARRG